MGSTTVLIWFNKIKLYAFTKWIIQFICLSHSRITIAKLWEEEEEEQAEEGRTLTALPPNPGREHSPCTLCWIFWDLLVASHSFQKALTMECFFRLLSNP